MELYLSEAYQEPFLSYACVKNTFPPEMIDKSLNYQEYISSGVKDTFLDAFFSSESCEPGWYMGSEGKPVYRKVIGPKHKE